MIKFTIFGMNMAFSILSIIGFIFGSIAIFFFMGYPFDENKLDEFIYINNRGLNILLNIVIAIIGGIIIGGFMAI